MTIALPYELQAPVSALAALGYRPLVVGGAVRDALLGLAPKDFDIEVYGTGYDELERVLAGFGRPDLVGKSFGVVKLGGHDFSIPRRDSKTGAHHRDFRTEFDPTIAPQEAASRRDFTINALMWDPVSGELLDYFGGAEDLSNRVLRATSEAFSDDPLRVLRGMQFACRFDLSLDPRTAEMSRAICDQYATLARERVAGEFLKWAEKSQRPGRIVEYLQQTGWIVHFPEIAALSGVPQDSEWHPEGDVDIHTAHVLDQAALVADRDGLTGEERAVLIFAALTHDFGKAATTAMRDRGGRQRWSAYAHEVESGPLSQAFLERIGIHKSIVDQVRPLSEQHMIATNVGRQPTPRSVRRLASRLAPASIARLLQLIEADASGRPPLPAGLPEGAQRLRAVAMELAVQEKPPVALILGRHVLPYFNDVPGRHIGEVTAAAYEAQLDGEFTTEEEAQKWLARRFENA